MPRQKADGRKRRNIYVQYDEVNCLYGVMMFWSIISILYFLVAELSTHAHSVFFVSGLSIV